MYDLVYRRARLSPDHLAAEDLYDGTRYTYRSLNERAARFAAAACEVWGLHEGDRVAWLGHNCAEFFAMLFGCAKAGLILVPLNWRLAVPELDALLQDAQPRVLIHTDDFAETAALLAARHSGLLQVGMTRGDGLIRDYAADLAAVTPDLAPHPERSADTLRHNRETQRSDPDLCDDAGQLLEYRGGRWFEWARYLAQCFTDVSYRRDQFIFNLHVSGRRQRAGAASV